MIPSADNAEHNIKNLVDDYLKEARASLDLYYEFHAELPDNSNGPTVLLEAIAASLVSIASSLEGIRTR